MSIEPYSVQVASQNSLQNGYLSTDKGSKKQLLTVSQQNKGLNSVSLDPELMHMSTTAMPHHFFNSWRGGIRIHVKKKSRTQPQFTYSYFCLLNLFVAFS